MEPLRIARRLRRQSTDAERKLWSRLRAQQLGYKFRRQVPIDRYIADFACIEAKLVIEVDGGQHNVDIEYDRERTTVIETAGYLVMRFWNNDALSDIDVVVEQIVMTLATRAATDS
jgi:very-short-patch-repair endonuclease